MQQEKEKRIEEIFSQKEIDAMHDRFNQWYGYRGTPGAYERMMSAK